MVNMVVFLSLVQAALRLSGDSRAQASSAPVRSRIPKVSKQAEMKRMRVMALVFVDIRPICCWPRANFLFGNVSR